MTAAVQGARGAPDVAEYQARERKHLMIANEICKSKC